MFLRQIVKEKKELVRELKTRTPLAELKRKAGSSERRGFRSVLNTRFPSAVNIIAEVKKASPSKGALNMAIDPGKLAVEYEKGGAVAISVLTEEKYFKGSIDFLPLVKKAVSLPVLRKDFIVDEYEIYEAKAYGADAVLLIAEILESGQSRDYLHIAQEIGIDVLLEVHDMKNYEKIAELGGYLLGINNRNLATLGIDLAVSEEIIARIPADKPVIVESGIETRMDIKRYGRIGVSGFLIGSSLVVTGDPAAKLKELRGVEQ